MAVRCAGKEKRNARLGLEKNEPRPLHSLGLFKSKCHAFAHYMLASWYIFYQYFDLIPFYSALGEQLYYGPSFQRGHGYPSG